MLKKVEKVLKSTALILVIISVIIINIQNEAYAKNVTGKDLEQQVEKIINKKVKKADKEKQKLKKLFNYIEKNYGYKRTMGFEVYNGWDKDYASEMYIEKKGSCYHFAAAYAFLAKKATSYKVRIGVGKTNGFSGAVQEHAWTEVQINSVWYICDTNMDKYAENSSGKYFLKKRNKLKSVYNNFKDVKYFVSIL